MESIETVALNLDLAEDAVKQRLSRGRKMLQEQLLAFVAGALARTNPGQAFTVAVLAALPITLATSATGSSLKCLQPRNRLGGDFFRPHSQPVFCKLAKEMPTPDKAAERRLVLGRKQFDNSR